MIKELAKRAPERDTKGFMRVPWAANIAILLVIILTAWASFVSQSASNDVKDQQDSQRQTIYCVKKILSKAVSVLNERSVYTTKQIRANVQLQTDFADLFNLLLKDPPASEKRRIAAARTYQASLNHFVSISGKQKHKVETNSFPSRSELYSCLER